MSSQKSEPLFYTAILSFFLFLMTLVIVDSNECVFGGTYLRLNNVGKSVTVQMPEAAKLQDVGDMKCAFKINGALRSSGNATVNFIAVEIESEVSEFCSVWKDYTICVCPFMSCNSLSGTLFESLLQSPFGEGLVKGEEHASRITERAVRGAELKMLIASVITAHTGKLFNATELESVMSKATLVEEFKRKHPRLLPDAARKQALIQLGLPITQVVVATETQPSSDSSFPWFAVIIGGVVALVGILVLVAILCLVCRKNNKETNIDSKAENSKENVSSHQKPKSIAEILEKESVQPAQPPKKEEIVEMEPTKPKSVKIDTPEGGTSGTPQEITGTTPGTTTETTTGTTTGGSAMVTPDNNMTDNKQQQ